METAVSDLEEDLCNARSRTEALHSDLSTLRQANLDLRKVQNDSLQTMSRPADHPAHLSKVQANVQAGQARQMSAFLQREPARLIGENKHTYELAKRGFQEEVSRLREEIRDLKNKMSSHIPDEPAHRSPAYSTQIRSLKLQVTELNKKLEAAMVVNQQLQQTTAPPTDRQVQELQSQVDNLSSKLQASHLSEMENLRTTHTTQSITLREEIVTLQAERRREHEHTQTVHTDLEEKITSLCKTVAETRAKAQADLHAAHTAQHRIAHAECLPAAASSSLQAEITEHLLTIADLQAELQTAKFSMDDFSISASRMERDLTNVEKKYDSTRTELSTVKLELFEATENVTRLSTELKDTAEDLRYQTSLVESSFRENKSIYTQHRDQRATVQELRMALKEAQAKITKGHSHTTSTACQTTLDLVALMELVQLNPVQLPPLDIPPSPSNSDTVRSQPKAPPKGQSLLPMASSVLKAASLHQTAQVPNIPPLMTQKPPTVAPGTTASVLPAPKMQENTAPSMLPKSTPSVSTPSQDSSVTGPVELAVPTQTNKSSSTTNDYIWSPPSEVYELKNKPPETPWAYFIGDSMFKYINPASIVSGGMISRKFHPHAEAVAWELNHLAPQLPKYNKYSDDGPGLDILIISVGTNDVSRVQKMGGIATHVDADKLMQSRIAQWPNHIIDLYKGATACLDKYGKAFVILPIGTNHIANEVSGISHFRHLAIQYAKQFPRVCLVTNSNMMRQDRALSHMIVRDDDPHYSDRGRQQMVSNLLYSMKHALPALYEYADIVNDYYERSQADPSIPSPRARFYRRSSKHTGIPDPGSSEPTPPTTKGEDPASGPQAPVKAPVKAPQTSKDPAHQDTTRKPVSVGNLVKSMTTPVPSYAAVAATKDSPPPLPLPTVSPGAKGQPLASASTEEKVHFPATDYRERLPPRTQQAATPVKGATPPGRPDQGPPPPGPSKDPVQLVASPELLQRLLESPEMTQYLLRMSDSTHPDRPK